MSGPVTPDLVAIWLRLGKSNPWIRRAWDPPFDASMFQACATRADLEERIRHGNWCLGQAFYLGDLCFIQQADGGDEWLTIRRDLAFESASLGRMLETDTFHAFLDSITAATDEQLRTLTYRQEPQP
mgnify:CR=1 FL=1